jgi:hypothetical protein
VAAIPPCQAGCPRRMPAAEGDRRAVCGKTARPVRRGGAGVRGMCGLVRHRQPKGAETDRPALLLGTSALLYPITGSLQHPGAAVDAGSWAVVRAGGREGKGVGDGHVARCIAERTESSAQREEGGALSWFTWMYRPPTSPAPATERRRWRCWIVIARLRHKMHGAPSGGGAASGHEGGAH